MAHVVFFLESDIDDSIWNVLPNSVQEFSLSDDYFKLRIEVYFVLLVLGISNLNEDRLLKHIDCIFHVFFLPGFK